ncbi:hypothetical protein ACFQZE_06890 [Paenibacillus sp. GCM10027627]|uniref:hypothetical protein n=1 Tax=unclassified Paenibacillus TaxID=185978 RepID=UPI003635F3BE
MTINKEFLAKLSDEELVAEFLDRDRWNDLKDKSESLVWKLCDRYDEEYSTSEEIFVDEMDNALTYEMVERFVAFVQERQNKNN